MISWLAISLLLLSSSGSYAQVPLVPPPNYFEQNFDEGSCGGNCFTTSDQSDPATKFNHWDKPIYSVNYAWASTGANSTCCSVSIRMASGSHKGYWKSYYRKNKLNTGSVATWGDTIYKTTNPTEWGAAYLRYYIKFDPNFSTVPLDDGQTPPHPHTGKIPGLAGTRQVGAGGSGSNGTTTNGWSARIAWKRTTLADSVTISGYVYTVDYGDTTFGGKWIPSPTPEDKAPRIKVGVWNKIEIYIGMNTFPYSNTYDGQFKLYINGIKRVEVVPPCCVGNLKIYKPDGSLDITQDFNPGLRFTTSDTTLMNRPWFDFYWGGVPTAPQNLYFWLDEIIMSPLYVGKLVASPSSIFSPQTLSLEQNTPNPLVD